MAEHFDHEIDWDVFEALPLRRFVSQRDLDRHRPRATPAKGRAERRTIDSRSRLTSWFTTALSATIAALVNSANAVERVVLTTASRMTLRPSVPENLGWTAADYLLRCQVMSCDREDGLRAAFITCEAPLGDLEERRASIDWHVQRLEQLADSVSGCEAISSTFVLTGVPGAGKSQKLLSQRLLAARTAVPDHRRVLVGCLHSRLMAGGVQSDGNLVIGSSAFDHHDCRSIAEGCGFAYWASLWSPSHYPEAHFQSNVGNGPWYDFLGDRSAPSERASSDAVSGYVDRVGAGAVIPQPPQFRCVSTAVGQDAGTPPSQPHPHSAFAEGAMREDAASNSGPSPLSREVRGHPARRTQPVEPLATNGRSSVIVVIDGFDEFRHVAGTDVARSFAVPAWVAVRYKSSKRSDRDSSARIAPVGDWLVNGGTAVVKVPRVSGDTALQREGAVYDLHPNANPSASGNRRVVVHRTSVSVSPGDCLFGELGAELAPDNLLPSEQSSKVGRMLFQLLSPLEDVKQREHQGFAGSRVGDARADALWADRHVIVIVIGVESSLFPAVEAEALELGDN